MPLPDRYGTGARAVVRMSRPVAAHLARGDSAAVDIVAAARLVAHRVAERGDQDGPVTGSRPLATSVAIEPDAGRMTVTVRARPADGPGGEVEAMAACIGAALAVYDLVRDVDPRVLIDRVELLEGPDQYGGRNGERAEGS
jgi:molybdenum cofactor biosynthesis enzyme